MSYALAAANLVPSAEETTENQPYIGSVGPPVAAQVAPEFVEV
jgi:hypothetical protein